MKILGIDPGLTKTGWGLILSEHNSLSFIASGTIYTNTKQPLSERINYLYHNISQVINGYKPDEVAIEETFVNINPASSLKLGHARGAIMLTVSIYNLKIFEYSATKIKKTVVGVGRADKNQVSAMVKILLPKANFKSEDEADALAAAICHNNNNYNYNYNANSG